MPNSLTDQDREALAQVLEPRPDFTRKGTPRLRPLSLYSSELKSIKQIASQVEAIHQNQGIQGDSERSRIRYFRSLEINGLVTGTVADPKLSAAGEQFRQSVEAAGTPGPSYWHENGNALELPNIRALVTKLIAGVEVTPSFLEAWFNAQTFFDIVPAEEVESILGNPDKLLLLFRINSTGWEIARYFRLSSSERDAFETAFVKVISDSFEPGEHPIDRMAAQYATAVSQVQPDVRFRVRAFLSAFHDLKNELGTGFPRVDRSLTLNVSVSPSIGGVGMPSIGDEGERTPLSHPLQLIVSGCPGSGKSFYVDSLIATSGAATFRTQFHPETSFFDFVGAYKPHPVYQPKDDAAKLQEGDGSECTRGHPLIDYRFVAGPFIRALVYALKHKNENVVLLIEELNRGNPAAIFGDVLQLLDRTDDGFSRYSVLTSHELHAHLTAESVAPIDHLLRLPPNLYIWATMNSADQGVFPIDTAFRRRWSYVYMGYTEPCLYDLTDRYIVYGGRKFDWDLIRSLINSRLIEVGIHEDKLIGPYFLTPGQLGNPDEVLEKLFLYLWDDVLRFRQDELFDNKSFSEVAKEWAKGKGSPIKIVPPEEIDQTSAGVTSDAAGEMATGSSDSVLAAVK